MKAVSIAVGLTVVLFLCLVSCSKSPEKVGDLAIFLATETQKYGAKVRKVGDLPTIHGVWSTKNDINGFQLRSETIGVDQVDQIFRALFGDPRVSEENQTTGQMYRVYAARDIGVAITYSGFSNEVEIVCVRPSSKW